MRAHQTLDQDRPSRRSFLGRSAVLVPGFVLATGASSEAARPKKPPRKPPQRPPSRSARLPDLFPGWDARNFREIMADENAHVAILQSKADNPRPKPTFRNLEQSNVFDFVQMAAALENGGVGAYLAGVLAISSGGREEYLPTATGILTIEARHTGYLNTLRNTPIAPGDAVLDIPSMQEDVRAAVAPFIVSFNGGPPMAFDPDGDSDENDQAIINFALVLEFLESEFYNLNVPRFFR